jgi:hypothetical protein
MSVGFLLANGNAPTSQPAPALTEQLFWLASIVVVLTFIALYGFLFFNRAPNRFQYRLIIILTFFATSVVIALLFAVSANMTANAGFVTFSLAGPAAVWLGGMWLFTRLYPEAELDRRPPEPEPKVPVHDWTTLAGFGQLMAQVDQGRDWNPYETWRGRLNECSELFEGGDEGNTLKHMLETACNPHRRERLSGTTVTTVFFYFRPAAADHHGYIVKLQRIEGAVPEGGAYVRYNSNASFVGSVPASVFLVGNPVVPSLDRMFTDHDQDGHHKLGYEQLARGTTDCLIVAGYEDFPPQHDYLLVDVDRFCGDDRGRIVLGVVSPGWPVRSYSAWMMRRPLASPIGTVPLLFRQAGEVPESRAELAAALAGWLAVLDRILDGPALAPRQAVNPAADPKVTLQTIRSAVRLRQARADFRFAELFQGVQDDHSRAFRIGGARNVIIALFQW